MEEEAVEEVDLVDEEGLEVAGEEADLELLEVAAVDSEVLDIIAPLLPISNLFYPFANRCTKRKRSSQGQRSRRVLSI